MDFKKFNKLNTIVGWAVFLFALIVYAMTMEQTVSFWDCGEFIASAFKQQPVHPPGSPMFGIISKIFIILGGNNTDTASLMVNFQSAFSSALTVLFIFWIAARLAIKSFTRNGEEITQGNALVSLGAALTAALTTTFLDSFWFSAGEGEVYAMASAFCSAMLWAMFKWERISDQPGADRWLIFIGFLLGLGLGVHWLHMLVLVPIVFIYYFKKYKSTIKGTVIAFGVGLAITGFMLKFVLDYFLRIGASVDKMFVNSMGLPFWSGALTWGFFTIAVAIGLIVIAHKRQLALLRTGAMMYIMVMLGFSSYSVIVIRAEANPPINMNAPTDPYTMHSYIKREQYGSRPLVSGPAFTAQTIPYGFGQVEGRIRYKKSPVEDKYVVVGQDVSQSYKITSEIESKMRGAGIPSNMISKMKRDNKMMFFPRLGSLEGRHNGAYRKWLGLKKDERPTFADNLKFFWKYQINYMYVRYFMWNFSGRQDDVQGHVNRSRDRGDWITGIGFIDRVMVGPEYDLRASTESKARNKFYMLPFILGIIGLFFHFSRDKKGALIVLMFFVFTGFLNIINMNQPPFEPRERDYAVAISFYAYALWVGLGVVGIFMFLRDKVKKMDGKQAAIVATALALVVPALMGFQGWDDHDRSDIHLTPASASCYLQTVDEDVNAILFTAGDNDTYPLWNVQEVENYRNDVRVVNTSLLPVDWYARQLMNKKNDNDAYDLHITEEGMLGEKRQAIPIIENKKFTDMYGTDLNEALKFVASDDISTHDPKQRFGPSNVNYLPTRTLSMPVDSAKVVANGIVPPEYADRIPKRITFTIPAAKQYLSRGDLMILEVLAASNWDRPMYFANSIRGNDRLGLGKYFQQEGLAYKIVPVEGVNGGREWLNSRIMYDKVMNKWEYGNLNEGEVHLNETMMGTAKMIRSYMLFLAQSLSQEGDNEKAAKVLDKIQEELPSYNVPYYEAQELQAMIATYYRANQPEKAEELINMLKEVFEESVDMAKMDAGYAKALKQSPQLRGENASKLLFIYAGKIRNRESVPASIREINDLYQGLTHLITEMNRGGGTEEAKALNAWFMEIQQDAAIENPYQTGLEDE